MADINRIRNEYFSNGKSISEIARITGHDRKTIRKKLSKKGFALKDESSVPKKNHIIDPFLPTIQTWLEENSHQWHKHRLSATRIHDLLQEQFPDTYHCSYRTLINTVNEIRAKISQHNDVYIPLLHPPGETQGDFGITYYYDNYRHTFKGYYFSLAYPHSNAGFTQLFRGETLECFLQGLQNIFQYTQSVPVRIWFDNATPLVKKILKEGKRIVADRFYRFANHYGFTPVFCNPHAPHEKGAIENKIGYHRRNLFTPYLVVTSLAKTNKELLHKCTEYNQKTHYLKQTCIQTLFQDDQKHSLPLPKEDFVIEKRMQIKTDKYGKIRVGKGPKIYSVGPLYSLKKVWICLGAETVRILNEDFQEIVSHPRLFGIECEESIKWHTYLPVIAKKPRSLPYTGLWTQLGLPIQEAFKKAAWKEQKQLLQILQKTTQEVGFASAVQAITQAVQKGNLEEDSVLMLARICKEDPLPPSISLPSSVPTVPSPYVRLDLYDAFLPNKSKDSSKEDPQ
ncbi:MAG: IS21 family transposase [Caldisericia bacterium]|nr:IS21 family transposase [Caldisericia bacterium]